MKRWMVCVAALLATGANLGALDLNRLSIGVGAVILPYAEGVNITAPEAQTGRIRNHWLDWGGYAFFDVRFIEFDVGYYRAFMGDYERSDFGPSADKKSEYDDISVSYLDIGILLKYPIKIGSASVVTPMVGFSYWINTGADYGYKRQDAAVDFRKKEWDQMWIKAGLGYDQYLTENLFLRFTGKLIIPLAAQNWPDHGNEFIKNRLASVPGVKAQYFGLGGEFSLAIGIMR
jgi:hypothetical protein